MKRTAVLIVAMMAVWGSAAALSAGESGDPPPLEILENRLTETVTMSDAVAYALQNSPQISASRENWRMAVEKFRVVSGYPDPQFMITYFPEPIETRLGPQDWNATLSQMIPFPGKLTKAGEVAAADARIARITLDKAFRDVAVAIRESYHELAYIRTAAEIAARNAALIDELRKIGEAAYAQDRAAFLDVVKAQSQTGQIRYDMLLLEELEQTEITRLNGLLNRPPEAPLGTLTPIPVRPVVFGVEELYRLAEENQDEIRMAGEMVEKADAQKSLAGFENLPDFRVGLFYAGIGDPDVAMPPPDAGDDAVGIQFGMSIPIWFGKNAGRSDGAAAALRKSKAEKTARITRARTQVRAVYFKLRNAGRLVALYENDLLPQALRSMETAETWFREGEGSFSDFVEAQTTAYNFQLSLARARADYGKALANLERIVGQEVTVRPTDGGKGAE